jgi:hypothetical protein
LAINNNGNGKNGRKVTKHHIIPKSRGGADLKDNIIKLPGLNHEAYHVFFGNLAPIEAKEFIDRVLLGKGMKRRKKTWSQSDLYELQLKLQQETIKREKKEDQIAKKRNRKRKEVFE